MLIMIDGVIACREFEGALWMLRENAPIDAEVAEVDGGRVTREMMEEGSGLNVALNCG